MKLLSVFFFFLCLSFLFQSVLISAQTEGEFARHFLDSALRLEFYHFGNSGEEEFVLHRIVADPLWSGSVGRLLSAPLQGRYRVTVLSLPEERPIYQFSYDSFFAEYKTTTPALKGQKQVYEEVLRIPRPKKNFRLKIDLRRKDNSYQSVFQKDFDLQQENIVVEPADPEVEVFDLLINGDPCRKVDLLIVAEGYLPAQKEKALQDARRFRQALFKYEPYKSNQQQFNLRLLFKPSISEGIAQPARKIFTRTPFGLSFDTFGLSRYVLCPELFALHRAAAHAPYDALLIMFNSKRYGGGGIYNFYATFPADNQWSEYIFIHEMGHSFAGLADEYYSSAVAYNDFYPAGVEPLEPNITAFLAPNDLKWKDLVKTKQKLPVPWEKEEFEKLENAQQKERAALEAEIERLYRNRADPEEIAALEKKFENLTLLHARRIDHFLQSSKFYGAVGVFEGAGYAAQGLYRSQIDCIMFTKGFKPFCAVCKRAIEEMIDYLCSK